MNETNTWTTCSVSYSASDYRKYTFKIPLALEAKVGQFALVKGNSVWPKLVQIVEIHNTPQIQPNAPFKYKWVVEVVENENIEAAETALDEAYPS